MNCKTLSVSGLKKRMQNRTPKNSTKGINKVAQKVGEEAVELIIEAKDTDDERFVNEAADLMYHFMVLLHLKKSTSARLKPRFFSDTKNPDECIERDKCETALKFIVNQ